MYLIDSCCAICQFIKFYSKLCFILFSAKYFNPRKWASNGPRLLSAALASQCDLSPDEFSHTLSIGPGMTPKGTCKSNYEKSELRPISKLKQPQYENDYLNESYKILLFPKVFSNLMNFHINTFSIEPGTKWGQGPQVFVTPNLIMGFIMGLLIM